MADTDPTPDTDPAPAPAPDPDDEPLGPAGMRALREEREARKAAEAQSRELREQLAARDRADVARAKGLPPGLAGRLTGDTLDELEADADRLLADLDAGHDLDDRPPRRMPGKPTPRLRGGGDPTEEPDPNYGALADRIMDG